MEKDTVRFGEREMAGGGSGKGQAEIFWGDGVESGIRQVQGGGAASNY